VIASWRVSYGLLEIWQTTPLAKGDEGCLHQLVIDIDDSAWVLDRSHIVICWLLIFCWFGRGGGEVALVRGLVRCLLDVVNRWTGG
jgi:hypothetical protein